METVARASKIRLKRLDHFVITCKDIEATGGRRALNFGQHKINLHEHGKEFEPKACWPTPGSADVCLISSTRLDVVMDYLKVS
nr:hypothetical protein BaRGS_024836 [Batillaria attramentaria]